MRSIAHLVSLLLILICAPLSAHAEITITPLGGTNRPWTLLSITGLPPGATDADITLQDARGGLAIMRRLPAGHDKLLIPLPFEAQSAITAAQWPIYIKIQGRDGAQARRIEVPVSGSDTFRVALPQGSLPQAAQLNWRTLSKLPVEWIELPEEQITTGPSLLFAACDALFIPPALEPQITQHQALALMSAGTRLITAGDRQPSGELSRLVWEPLTGNARPAWSCPATPLRPPTLIEPELEQIHNPPGFHDAPPNVKAVALAIGPAAIFLLLIARGLFRRRGLVLLAAIIAMTALGLAAILILRNSAAQTVTLAQWSESRGTSTTSVGALELHETLITHRSLISSQFHMTRPSLLPIAQTPADYWSLRELRLDLTDSRLEGRLPARRDLRLQQRELTTGGVLPPFPQTPQDRLNFARDKTKSTAWWVIEGYVYPQDASSLTAGGTVFSNWVATQNAHRPSLDAWYALRFNAAVRYFLWTDATGLHIVAFAP